MGESENEMIIDFKKYPAHLWSLPPPTRHLEGIYLLAIWREICRAKRSGRGR